VTNWGKLFNDAWSLVQQPRRLGLQVKNGVLLAPQDINHVTASLMY